jgi:ABC-type uncharacterized transport system permease subunit
MGKSKPRSITESQATIVIVELGVVAVSSLMVIAGTVASWFKVRRKATEVLERVT